MFLALAPQIRRSRSMPNTPARPPQPLWTTSPAIGDGLLQIPPKLFMRGNGVASRWQAAIWNSLRRKPMAKRR